jgi:hypothetical protein
MKKSTNRWEKVRAQIWTQLEMSHNDSPPVLIRAFQDQVIFDIGPKTKTWITVSPAHALDIARAILQAIVSNIRQMVKGNNNVTLH